MGSDRFSTIPSRWNFRTCFHGIEEGLDSHDCPQCLEIAKKLGRDCSNQTYIFTKDPEIKKIEIGQRIEIPVCVLEFNNGSNTIWIQSPEGATILRIKCTGKINIDQCNNSPTSHSDIIVNGDINICLSEDAN